MNDLNPTIGSRLSVDTANIDDRAGAADVENPKHELLMLGQKPPSRCKYSVYVNEQV